MKIKRNVFFVAVDIIFLVLFAFFIPEFLQNTVGYDVIEYENWFGEISNPIVYRFGAGCWEITIIMLKMIGFIVCQFLMQKGQNKKQIMWIVASHVVIGVLGLIFVFVYADGSSFLHLLQCILNN